VSGLWSLLAVRISLDPFSIVDPLVKLPFAVGEYLGL